MYNYLSVHFRFSSVIIQLPADLHRTHTNVYQQTSLRSSIATSYMPSSKAFQLLVKNVVWRSKNLRLLLELNHLC